MTVDAALTTAFRTEWGQVVATLIRITGDRDLAEECAQDAFALALQTWPRDGVPSRPPLPADLSRPPRRRWVGATIGLGRRTRVAGSTS